MSELIPYVQVNGQWSLPDTTVHAAWDLMVAEGTAKRVFCAGGVQNAGQLVEFLKSPWNVPHFQFDGPEMILFAWLNQLADNHAFGHFAGFKAGWGNGGHEALRRSLEYWFHFEKEDGPRFDVILGSIAENNRLAIKYAERAGCKIVGKIPTLVYDHYNHRRVGAVMLYAERGDFDGRHI